MRKETKKTVEVVHTELVLPGVTNHYGTIFGGKTLAMMDMTGALAAMQFCNEDVVTASFESIDFKRPIKEGDITEVKAKVVYTSNTSMVVKIDVYKVGGFIPERIIHAVVMQLLWLLILMVSPVQFQL